MLALVNSINNKYGEGPSGSGKEVVYFEERADADITLPKRLAFFAASHVLMITAPRYIYIEKDENRFFLPQYLLSHYDIMNYIEMVSIECLWSSF